MKTLNAAKQMCRPAPLAIFAAFAVIAVFAFGPSSASAQDASIQDGAVENGSRAEWTVSESTPCVGLTASWAVPAADLDRLLAPGLSPAISPDGKGTLMLFAASCPASTIDGAETGPVSTAHVLVPLAGSRSLPTVPTVDENAWIAVPWTVGSFGNPVTDLFRRFAFAVSPGDLSFTWHPGSDGSPTGARFKLMSEDGEIDVAAQFDSEPEAMGAVSGLIDARGRPMDVLFAHGPERASRYRNGKGRVSIQGETVLSGFGLDPAEAALTLDVDFSWEFVFVSGAGR